MENRATTPLSQLQVGEEGFCTLDAIYVAPSAPSGPDEGRDVATTALFLLPDAEVHAEPVMTSKVHVQRVEDGLVIRVPKGEVPSRYLPQIVPGSLPVVATE